MPKRSNEFQRLIFLIESQIADMNAKVTESLLMRDLREGVDREIDVAIEIPQGARSLLVAVECIDHKRRADVRWVDGIVGKCRDLPVDRVVAVSRAGFSKAALSKARLNRIDAIGFEQAERLDWSTALGSPVAFCYDHIQVRPKRINYAVEAAFDFTDWPTEQVIAARVIAADGTELGSIESIHARMQEDKAIRQQLFEALKNRTSIRVALRADFPAQSRMIFGNGHSCVITAIESEIEYIREEVWMPLAHIKYGDARVVHARQTRSGLDIQFTATRLPDRAIRGSVLFGNTAGRTVVILHNGETVMRSPDHDIPDLP